MDWESQFRRWYTALHERDHVLRQSLEQQARTVLQNRKLADVEWHLAALAGETEEAARRRFFLYIALKRGNQMPARLIDPMIRAGVYERNPSINRYFLEPCLRCVGPRRVNERLLEYLEGGTDEEKAGAASAFYWSWIDLEGVKVDDISDLRARVRNRLLQEFVANEHVQLRRNIVPWLRPDPSLYAPDLQPLIVEAIRIARAHPDEYIRHRIEIQLGSGRPYMPLLP